MIPMCSRESVEFVDNDGTAWKFKPKTGTLENQMFTLYGEGMKYDEIKKNVSDFVDKILISPKGDYNSEEHREILNLWNEANHLSTTEKKS